MADSVQMLRGLLQELYIAHRLLDKLSWPTLLYMLHLCHRPARLLTPALPSDLDCSTADRTGENVEWKEEKGRGAQEIHFSSI